MNATEIVLSLAVVAALYAGACWARARRNLVDLRKTRATIPELRQALYLDGRRLVVIAAAALVVLWLILAG